MRGRRDRLERHVGGWLGFERDQALCRQITEATGIPATTSVLALNEIFDKTGVRRFGLVSPYLDEVQQRIVRHYEQARDRMCCGTTPRSAGQFQLCRRAR